MGNLEELNVKDIPVMPQVASKILQIQEDNFVLSFRELEKMIIIDPALTARILKIANSSLYARQREITNLQQALTLLGINTVKSLVLLVCASNLFHKSAKAQSTGRSLWKHLILTAFIARHMASQKSVEINKEDAFIAGLLHDIGKIMMLHVNPERYIAFANIENPSDNKTLADEDTFWGYNHTEAGRFILQKWNFPDELIDCAEQHHSINVTSRFKNLVILVGLSNIYATQMLAGQLKDEDLQLKEFYIKGMNITEKENLYYEQEFLDAIKDDDLYVSSSSLL